MTDTYRATVALQTRARTFRFPLEAVRVERGRHLHLAKSSRLFANNGLVVLDCDAATALNVGPGLCAIWCPLKGEVQIAENGAHFAVPKRFVYVADSNRSYDAEVPASATCIAIVAPQTTWAALHAFGDDTQYHAPAVFPALHP